MLWTVTVEPPALRALNRIQNADRARIRAVLASLESIPFGGDLKYLTNDSRAKYRRRVGSWRIFFDANTDMRVIHVKAIERRTSSTY